MKIFQKGFNYSEDGKGNRLVYHLKGCNMHCPWCSNPEGMDFDGGTFLSPEDILKEAELCRPMFFDGGGVTFTGGECTCQFEELKEALTFLKKAGINTCAETNGTSKRLPELFPLLDEIIMDFKHPDSDTLALFTGVGNKEITENIKAAAELGCDLLIRIPLIGGFNTGKENVKKFAEILSPYRDKITLELLKYHEYGKDKWKKCGKEYTVKDAFVSESERKEYEGFFMSCGIKTVRT